MSEKLTIILGGFILPDQTQLLETTIPNETDTRTLDGTLYTDFIGINRSWLVALLPLCRDDWDALYAVYRSQYTNETYLPLVCAARDIDTIVKMNISDQDIKWNGDRVDDFSVTLKEAYAIS
jgi:hypothetical protein